jgi:hypothetical protein
MNMQQSAKVLQNPADIAADRSGAAKGTTWHQVYLDQD